MSAPMLLTQALAKKACYDTPQARMDYLETGELAQTGMSNLGAELHGKVGGLARWVSTEEGILFEPFATLFPLNPDITPADRVTVAKDFSTAEAFLKGHARSGDIIIPQAEILRDLSNFYHMLLPATPQARYLRELIEKTVTTLELGAIAPLNIPPQEHIHPILVRTQSRAKYRKKDGSSTSLLVCVDNAVKTSIPIADRLRGDPLEEVRDQVVDWEFWESLPASLKNMDFLRGMIDYHNLFCETAMKPNEPHAPHRKADIQLVYSIFYHLLSPSILQGEEYKRAINEMMENLNLALLEKDVIMQKTNQLSALTSQANRDAHAQTH